MPVIRHLQGLLVTHPVPTAAFDAVHNLGKWTHLKPRDLHLPLCHPMIHVEVVVFIPMSMVCSICFLPLQNFYINMMSSSSPSACSQLLAYSGVSESSKLSALSEGLFVTLTLDPLAMLAPFNDAKLNAKCLELKGQQCGMLLSISVKFPSYRCTGILLSLV